MTIADTQRDLIRQQILQEELRKGTYPSVLQIEKLIDKAFQEKAAGLPRFTFREQKKGEASSSKKYNQSFQEAYQDFIVGFEEIKRLNNRLMSLTHYYESNRMKINKLLDELEKKTGMLQTKAYSNAYQDILVDHIHTFQMIDFKGDLKRNIPKTTAFVNLVKSDIEMKRKKNGTYKYDISNAKVTFTVNDNHQIIHLSSPQNALNDLLHEAWRTIIVTKEPIPVTAYLIIEFQEPISVTNVTIDMQAGKPIYTTLLISEDGEQYIQLEKQKIVSSYQWVFETRMIQAIKFQLDKLEEDRPNGGEYEYYFGAKMIEVTENEYEDEAVFVSKPYLLHKKAVHQISLDVDEYLPPDTSIRYYIGFDYGNNILEWQEIRKDRPIVTDMVNEHHMEINRYTSGYGDMMYERFGAKFYRVAKLPHRPLEGTIELMIGRNMWLKETIPAPFKYEPTDDESDQVVYQTGVHDWVRASTSRKRYVRIQNGFDYLQENKFHRYTTYIHAEEAGSLSSNVQGSSGTSHAVFINGSQIKGVNHKYDLKLQKGWNKIEVYVYAREINQEIILDFYVPNINHQIFANKEPLEEVSLYDLLNNTSVRQHNRFAIDEDNNIIVNYNPKELDSRGMLQSSHKNDFQKTNTSTLSDGLEYALTYRYSLTDKEEHALRFMAILTKENHQAKVTPRIRGYQLTIE